MSTRMKPLFAVLGTCLLASSCGPAPPSNQKPTFPVKGELLVDGKAVGDVAIACENLQAMDSKNPTLSSARTAADGKFAFSTYKEGDGLPEGEYALTFSWREYSPVKHSFVGSDKLRGRYKDPKLSKVRVKVEKGKPVDPVKVELTTK